MPGFTKDAFATPFGGKVFLRSTQDVKTQSWTVAKSTVRSQTIDGVAGQKVLHKGTVMAKITSGGDSGKIGPFHNDASVTDGRQTAANIVGINNTFLPWQLVERDVEVSVVYEAACVQANCTEYTGVLATPAESPLTNTTATAMVASKTMDIRFPV